MSATTRSHSARTNRSPAPAVIDRVSSAANTVNTAVNDAAKKSGLAERVAQNPYGLTAAALAVGYIAGGGLFSRSTARLVAFGAEISRVPVVRERLVEFLEQGLEAVIARTR